MSGIVIDANSKFGTDLSAIKSLNIGSMPVLLSNVSDMPRISIIVVDSIITPSIVRT